jgi:YggT family protein
VIILLINLVNLDTRLIGFLIIVYVVLSYFMDPYHPIREWVDRLVKPMLRPIRRVIPTVGMFDFSPLILLILVQLLGYALTRILILFL